MDTAHHPAMLSPETLTLTLNAMATATAPSSTAPTEVLDVDAFVNGDFHDDDIVMTAIRLPRAISSGVEHDDRLRYTSQQSLHARFRSISDANSEVIVIEEQEDVVLSSGSSRPLLRPKLRSPPSPPPRQRGHTSFIPRLPHHDARHSSFTPRSGAHCLPASGISPLPVVRSHDQPLSSGEDMRRIHTLPSRSTSLHTAALASSRQLTTGFGGALLSLDAQNMLEEAARSRVG